MAKVIDTGTDHVAGRIANTGGAALCDVADGAKGIAGIATDFMSDDAQRIAGGTDGATSPAARGANNIAGQVLGKMAALVIGAVAWKFIKAAHGCLLRMG
jgi:hypothetical protein